MRPAIVSLGLAQLISWGITYYLIGGFGDAIADDLSWPRSLVQGGFSTALIAMGAASPITGTMIDRHGGRRVMAIGSVLNAAGCAMLAVARTVPIYYGAWICLGVGMRLTLYDAAFAALARIEGPLAKRSMSQITLFGGLASTVFWPIGYALAEHFGWRGALLVYAAIALTTVPLHLALPAGRYADAKGRDEIPVLPSLVDGRTSRTAGVLYAVIIALVNFLNSGMSAHMIGLLIAAGLTGPASVWIATLRGIGQSSARLGEVLFGSRVAPLNLNVGATFLLPVCFAIGLLSGQSLPAAGAFALLYGVGNGIVTITRGTLPIVLFDHRMYGALTGWLLVPSFILSAAAPVVYAVVIRRFGAGSALGLSIAVASVAFAASVALKMICPPTSAEGRQRPVIRSSCSG